MKRYLMKNEFIGYYDPTETEIETSWTTGVFVFDANTLLNLYRYSAKTKNDFVSVIKSLKPNLYLPYQVALEFHNNRRTVIKDMEGAYQELLTAIDENFDKKLLAQIRQFKRHPTILIDEIITLHDQFKNKVSKELEKQRKEHPSYSDNDPVLNDITEIFDKFIGEKPSKEQLAKTYQEGKLRYQEKIPPGFKDLETKGKKGDRHLYGDLIIWQDLIERVKVDKRPIILITDDAKEDWWQIENGKTIGPHPDLIKEFFDQTGIRILIYNTDRFLSLAKSRGVVKEVSDSSIVEITDIRESEAREQLFKSYINLTGFYESPIKKKGRKNFLWHDIAKTNFFGSYRDHDIDPNKFIDLLKYKEMMDRLGQAKYKNDKENPQGNDEDDLVPA